MVVLMKRILGILTVVLMLGMSGTARATGQIPDLLVVGGDTLALFCNPLEGYFDAAHPRPDDMYGLGSTACYRGYQATFELRQDSLFLTAIRIGERGDSTDFYPMERLFGYQTGTDGVFAYWVNDTLTCVDGECLYYIHMGYASIYEFDINYIVRHGLVKEKQVFDNRKTFLPYSDEHGGLSARLLQTFVEQQIDYSGLAPNERHTYVQVLVKEVDGDGRIKKVEINGESRRQERAPCDGEGTALQCALQWWKTNRRIGMGVDPCHLCQRGGTSPTGADPGTGHRGICERKNTRGRRRLGAHEISYRPISRHLSRLDGLYR